jgi:hypothetical protein
MLSEQTINTLVQFGVLIFVLCVEAWLGKTEKTQSGSILEMTARAIVRIIKSVLFKQTKGVTQMEAEKAKAKSAALKIEVPMTEAYDVKVLAARLKKAGVEHAEKLVGDIYFVTKDWAKESAPLSSNKIDDLAAPFYDQADSFVVPQIDKMDGKEGN